MKVLQANELLERNKIVKHYGGSISYGTNLPTSDVDFRGIFCAEPVNILTPFFPVRECEDSQEEDTKYYELAHFMKLCLDCNPNIIETLWVDESDIVFRTEAYDFLREHREDLLSSKIAFTTSGYALAQLKRIKGHNKWINNPQPEDPPTPREFLSVVQYLGDDKRLKVDLHDFFENHLLVPYGGNTFGVCYQQGSSLWDDSGNLKDRFDGDRTKLENPILFLKWNKEEYRTAKERHTLYWNWKRNRNAARSALEEQHGFDTKHAMHLVRLLRMGEEALRGEGVIVKRPDAEELLSIRHGSWTYEQIVAYAEEKDKFIREELYKKTDLRKKPDLKRAAEILMQVQELIWSADGRE